MIVDWCVFHVTVTVFTMYIFETIRYIRGIKIYNFHIFLEDLKLYFYEKIFFISSRFFLSDLLSDVNITTMVLV